LLLGKLTYRIDLLLAVAVGLFATKATVAVLYALSDDVTLLFCYHCNHGEQRLSLIEQRASRKTKKRRQLSRKLAESSDIVVGEQGTDCPPNFELTENCLKSFFLAENFCLEMTNLKLKAAILEKFRGKFKILSTRNLLYRKLTAC